MGWSTKKVARSLGASCERDEVIEGFAIDSRNCLRGSLFFALQGQQVDGHAFLKDASNRGAKSAVVDEEFQGEIEGLTLIRVPDVLKALQALAKGAYGERKRQCIAITGSVGKTTTKEFVSELLQGAFSVFKTPGNANSQAGLALSLLDIHKEEVCVLEMGMSRPGEISALVEIAPPDIAVVTKVALAHALYFPGGLEEIAKAKAEILRHPQTKRAFVHRQAKMFSSFQSISWIDFYGLALDGLSQDEDFLLDRKEGRWTMIERGEKTRLFSLPFEASHLCENFLAAAAVCRTLGLDWEEIFSKSSKLSPYKMRFERIEKKGVVYINDSYNANPASVTAALRNLPKPIKGGKTWAVLGEMRELGAFSKEAHEQIGKEASLHVDELLCLGKECLPLFDVFLAQGLPAFYFDELADLKQALAQKVQEGDVVLIKASKSLQMWKVLEEEKKG